MIYEPIKKNSALFVFTLAMLLSNHVANAVAQTPEEETQPAIKLGAPIGDNAVLQREMPVPVWGWSKPETRVTVQFAGQKITTASGIDGKWILTLDALEASFEPREMVITNGPG